MARPKADLDSITVPKGDDEPQVAAPAVEAPVQGGYAHTLSLRLKADGYRKLRRYVAEQEEKTGKRITHQSLIENLLLNFLDDQSKG